MQNTSDNMSEPLIQPQPLDEVMVNSDALVGQPDLKKCREAKRQTIGDVAYALKVSPRVIEALEAGAWEKLPGRTFAVGILRAYGRLLEISVDSVVDTIPGASTTVKKAIASNKIEAKPTPKKPSHDGETKRQTNRMLKAGLVMLLIAVALAYAVPRETMNTVFQDVQTQIQRLIGSKAPEPAPEVSQEAIQPAATGEQQTPAASEKTGQQVQTGAGTLELRFSAPAWVEVRDHTGRIIYSQLNAAGTTQFITGAAPLDVMIGNAKQVQARWRDEPIKLDKLSGDDVARQILR